MRFLTWGAALVAAVTVDSVAAGPNFGFGGGLTSCKDACAQAVYWNGNGKADCHKYMTATAVLPTQ